MEKIEGKKYSLHNSYFRFRKQNYPDTLLEIIQYQQKYNELPFEYHGKNWVYDTMCERQKKAGVHNSQYITPPVTARYMAELTDSFHPKGLQVLNACCGVGQITKFLLESGLEVTGFDKDTNMVEICRALYPQGKFEIYDFEDKVSDKRWDLIVANPPHDKAKLIAFIGWLSTALSEEGKAILILPVDYFSKKKPKVLAGHLEKLAISYSEKMTESFFHTKQHENEIVVVELSSDFRNELIKYQLKTNNKKDVMETNKIELIALDRITMNPLNPRRRVKEEEIQELARGIKKIGLLQPITLRKKSDRFEIVAGERRFRAFQANGEEFIPAIIRDVTDIEAMEMALAENINRSDLSPIEEANAFQFLLSSYQYKVEDLVNKFGKTDTYIRGRLRLLNLIEEFQGMLDGGQISIGIGIELSRYSQNVQKDVLKEHFSIVDDNSSWRDLGTRDFSSRMTRLYSMNLSDYQFDKTTCRICPFNTDISSLFEQDKGKCTNIECLKEKRNEFTLSVCREKTGADGYEVCIAPFDKVNPNISEKLKEEGIKIKTAVKFECPEPPQEPKRSDYKLQFQYDEAIEKFKFEEMAYFADLDDYEEKVEQGEYKKCVYIGSNNPIPCYVPIEKKEKRDPVTALKQEDEKNRESAIKSIYTDSLNLLLTKEIPISPFSEFEDDVFSFFLLDYLDRKFYKLLGIKDDPGSTLPDKEKEEVLKNLTNQQVDIIKRAFIMRRISTTKVQNTASRICFLLPEFVKQHFPNETNEIVNKHMAIYSKQQKNISEKLKKVKTKNVKTTVEA